MAWRLGVLEDCVLPSARTPRGPDCGPCIAELSLSFPRADHRSHRSFASSFVRSFVKNNPRIVVRYQKNNFFISHFAARARLSPYGFSITSHSRSSRTPMPL
jgi:hypothetical protein